MPSLGTLKVNIGFVGPAAIDFGEDVSMCQMTATVYSVSPTSGQGGTPLFTRAMAPVSGQPTQQAIPLVAADTAAPRMPLYGRIDVVYPGAPNDLAQLFSFAVDGR
jgi:hypothetical protein